MGLKTTNYEVKRKGITLPEAYAIVKDLTVRGKSGFAIIAVQSSRDNCEKVVNGELEALEEVRIDFTVNRDANNRATAYEQAKSQRAVTRWNMETQQLETVLVNEPFYGWDNDIVTEATSE